MTIVEERTAVTGGVDTHSEVHVAAALDSVGGLLGTREFPATAVGYASLLGWLGRFGDVALVGFDNWEPMVLGAQPPLTSVDMCLEEVGRVAAEMLLAAIAGEPSRGTHTEPSRLVVRKSSC